MQTAHLPLDDAAYGEPDGIEIRMMRPADIDWNTRLWKKPKTKNGTTHICRSTSSGQLSGRCAQGRVSAVGGGILWERGSAMV